MINPPKLSKELIAAGISTQGNCNSSGIVWDDNNNEIQTRPDVASIVAAHDPIDHVAISIAARVANAKQNAGKVSELKGISISQANTWITRKLHGSDTETSLDAAIDAAITVADLKMILKNVIATSYKRTETDKIILALLISIADQIMPDR